jgi:DNA-binding beta-propeller fold protein YncE
LSLHRPVFALFLVWTVSTFAQHSDRIMLPSSKSLGQVPGEPARTNGYPATIALSPDGRYAALLHDGYGAQSSRTRQSISILDFQTGQLTDFPDDRLAEDARQSYFLGLAFSADGKHLYASMGSITDPSGTRPGDVGNAIAVYRFHAGTVTAERIIAIPPQKVADGKWIAKDLFKTARGTAIPYPAGLAVVPGSHPERLLIANNLSDNVILLDTASGQILKSFDLSTSRLVPTSYPYAVSVSRDGRRAWCSLWNASKIAELDLDSGSVTRWIPLAEPGSPTAPGSHPTAMLLSPDESLLYVALANADLVVAVSTGHGTPQRFFSTRLPGQQYAGTIPLALAQTPDGKRLFAALATLDAVAVFDLAAPAGTDLRSAQPALGFIPAEWYPSAVAFDEGELLVATAKGRGTGPNNYTVTTNYGRRHREHPYIPTLLNGSLARIHYAEAEADLPKLTREVEDSNLMKADPGKIVFASGSNPIKHVIYIIKENRTYDQILGDLKAGNRRVGNGDPSLTLYGQTITPNEHKLALQFGILDNFYDSGEVSGDGHVWSTAAITSDYNEKTWPIGYRGHERTYDHEGTVAGEYPIERDVPDVDSPSTGYLWTNAARHRLSLRDYGEFIATEFCVAPRKNASSRRGTPEPGTTSCARNTVKKGEPLPENVGQPHGSLSPYPWTIPMIKRGVPTMPELVHHADLKFAAFEVDYPDQLRADEFLNEFEGFVKARRTGRGEELPALVIMHLPDDHTGGTRAGKPTPSASVADNDLALGRIVDAVSHSPYWDDTAIFIIEDDAQDGADHVDAHRSIAFVVSKYAPASSTHPALDHTFYTTVSMVRTIENLLGLPPMNLNDGYAPLMAWCFSGPGNHQPFTRDERNRKNGLIYRVNPPTAPGAKESALMDFSRPDAVNTPLLNAILWRDRKGKIPLPAALQNAKPKSEKDADDD